VGGGDNYQPSFFAVWGSSATDIYVAGENALFENAFGAAVSASMLHYDGFTWEPVVVGGFEDTITSLWGASGQAVFAVSARGKILYFNGAAWQVVADTGVPLFSIWGRSRDDLFAGSDAALYHYNGLRWQKTDCGCGAINDIWGTTNNLFIVTDGCETGDATLLSHAIIYYDGACIPTASGTDRDRHGMRAVWGSAAANVFAAGDNGTILHYAGAPIAPVDTSTTTTSVSASEGLVADFTAEPTQGAAPLDVSFTSLAAGPAVFWAWSFGDGSTSTLEHPAHTYVRAGIYDVSFTVSDAHGNEATKTRSSFIEVLPGEPCVLRAAERDREHLSALRSVRDRLLENPLGAAAVSQYYRHAGELYAVVTGNPELYAELQLLLRKNMRMIIQAGQGERCEVSDETMAEVLLFLDDVREVSGPALSRALDFFMRVIADTRAADR